MTGSVAVGLTHRAGKALPSGQLSGEFVPEGCGDAVKFRRSNSLSASESGAGQTEVPSNAVRLAALPLRPYRWTAGEPQLQAGRRDDGWCRESIVTTRFTRANSTF